MLTALNFDDLDCLRDSDLAGLDVLGFGQSQRHKALLDLRAGRDKVSLRLPAYTAKGLTILL